MSRKALPALVVTLLLANGVLLAAQRGLFGPEPLSGWGETRREPQRARHEMGAERLKLVASRAPAGPAMALETGADNVAEKVAATAAEKTAATAADKAPATAAEKTAATAADKAPATAADKTATAGEKAAATAADKATATAAEKSALLAPQALAARVSDKLPGATGPVCMEIGGFSAQAVRQVVSALAADKALQVEQFERQGQVRWWIHLQPQATKEDVDRKLAELRRRNVTDYAIVPGDGYTISLGVFKERERAEQYLATLREQGVRTAVLSDMPHGPTRQWLRVREARETKSAQPVAHEGEARTVLERLRRRYGGDEVVPCRA